MLWPCFRDPEFDISANCIQSLIDMGGDTALKIADIALASGHKVRSFAELVQPLTGLLELVLCYPDLEISNKPGKKDFFYIGAGMDQRRHSGELDLVKKIGSKKKIIYASMGSQAVIFGEDFNIFCDKLINVMKLESMKDCHLVISIGKENDPEKFYSSQDNVTIVKWISQFDILKTAAMAIFHGGLGTIKECVYHCVPMIIVPLVSDSFANGRRVEFHKLGLMHQIGSSVEDLEDKIRILLDDTDVSVNLREMKKRWVELDRENLGVGLIEKLI